MNSFWENRVPVILGVVVLNVLLAQPGNVLAQSNDESRLLAGLRDSVCFAETFGEADIMDDLDIGEAGRKQTSGIGLTDLGGKPSIPTNRPGMLTGKSVAGRASSACNSISVPVAKAIPFSTGTLSWWVRFNYSILDGGTLLTLDGGGPLYVNFFGKNNREHPNMGHYWNVLAGSPFVFYPNLIEPDVWHHCAFTWNGDRTVFYFDGVSRSGSMCTRPFSGLLNGKVHKASTFELCGNRALFDEIRVYNRALSARDVRVYVDAVRAGGARRDLALALPKQSASRDTFGTHAVYRLSDHSVLTSVDLSTIEPADDKKLSIAILDSGRETLAFTNITPSQTNGMVHITMPLQSPLPTGIYQVQINWAGHQSMASLERIRFEWENNGIGLTNTVISPWTPMQVEGAVATCWGRKYTFGPLGLPMAIHSTQPEPSRGAPGKELLAEPVQLIVEGTHGAIPLKGTALQVRLRDETAVEVTATAEGPGLTARLDGSLEFDGLYKFTLQLTPTGSLALISARLEAALPDELALLFNASGEDMRRNKAFLNLEDRPEGELWNSVISTTFKPEQVLKKGVRQVVGNLWPHLWLGDDDRGLAVMCDTDRGWLLDEGKPCMDLVRRGGQTILRIHLVNKPAELKEPLAATLSIQATPVRSRPKGGSWKKVGWYGWSCFDAPIIWDGCFDAYSVTNAPKMFVTEEARRQNRWWRYFCMQSHRISSSDSHYAMVAPNTCEWEGGLHVPSHRDFLLWVYKQWRDKVGLKGFYMDNTYAPLARTFASGLAWEDATGRIHPTFNTFGSRELLKRARTLFLEAGPSPVMYAHMTDAPIIGYLGFFDQWLDGENDGYNNLLPEQAKDETDHPEKYFHDFVDRWYNPTGMANLRITLGRQWGIMPKYLYEWGADATFAVLGQFDLDNGFRLMGRKPLYDFGLDKEDVVFIPYWDVRRPVAINGGVTDVLPAVWMRSGRARVLLSNMGADDRIASVTLNLEKLGLPNNTVVVDELDGASVPCLDGTATNLLINRHNFRLLLAAAPGVFPPENPDRGKALAPAKRIEFFCDDFSALHAVPASGELLFVNKTAPLLNDTDLKVGGESGAGAADDKELREMKEKDMVEEAMTAAGKHALTEAQQKATCWRMLSSPNIEMGAKSPLSAFDIKQGQLRIRNDSYHYAFIYRPFYQDMCSVQVKIGESTDNYGPDYGPSLFLYWNDRNWVRMRAGMERGGPRDKAWAQAIVCEGAGQDPFRTAGPKAGVMNWVKIRLAPNEIEFYASTDGKAWEKIHARSRNGYRGAPAYVLLGHGAAGHNRMFQNDSCNERCNYYSFFDDFTVGRER